MQQTEQFIRYMKVAENAQLLGGDLDYLVHRSPEGGLDTCGYGHKLNVLEKSVGQVYGFDLDNLTPEACDYILALDINNCARDLAGSIPVWKGRTLRQQEMLVEFQYNLGSVQRKFPKFTQSVLIKDLNGQRAEYKRHYTAEKGRVVELKRRNRLFYTRYLSPTALKAWGSL